MKTMSIKKSTMDGPAPLYRRVATAIQTRIDSGEWDVGTRLPADGEIASMLGVHWQTVQRAMQELQQQGSVLRQPNWTGCWRRG